VALALLVGCGGGAAQQKAATEPNVDVGDAGKAARGVLTEIYGDLRRGDVGGVQSLVAPAPFVVGPGASDVFLDRADAIVALGGFLRSGDRHKLTSKRLAVVVSPGGHSAWASDTLDVEGVTVALSAVLVESDGLWTVEAVHVGRVLGEAQRGDAAKARGEVPAAAPSGTAEAVKLYKAGLAAPASFADQLGTGADVLWLGVGPKDSIRGTKAIKKAWKKRLATPPRLALVGNLRAGVTPDGALVWIFADLDVTAEGAAKQPLRELAIYARDGARAWKLVALHDSLAVGK
jgi:hypothetical protein